MNLSIPANVYDTHDIGAGTNRPDVSEILELWAHEETPLLNRIAWGPDSGGLQIEWITEHLGWMYVETSAAIASDGTALKAASGVAGLSCAEQMKQIRVGTLLYAKGVAASGDQSGDHSWMVVSTVAATYTATTAFLSSTTASIAASAKVYVVGCFANEGAEPDKDTSRVRTAMSNAFAILAKDIEITGSQAATDMYAITNELQHQIKLRMLEMQFERERSILYSWHATGSATVAPMFYGVAELLLAQSANSFVDDVTTTLTESAFNDLMADVFDNGGRPDVVVGSVSQIRKFTSFNADRIRTTPDNRIGGNYVTQYLTDTGITVDLVPLRKAIPSFLFILDTEKLRLRAKRGRKLLMNKLGKTGDYDRYQIVSEYSLEHHGIANGEHGMFSALT
jgi:hypothetical protein